MLKQVMGTYIPSAFSIYLNTAPEKLDTKDATFVHEYIHFLQDIILPYCIRQNLVFINNLACISKEAETTGNLECPFSQWSEDSQLTFAQTSYTWGAGNGADSIGEITYIQQEFFTSSYGHKIFRYCLEFDDGSKYQFGARDFLEYIAHKIENQFYETSAPDLPYRTIDKVFDYYSLGFVPENVKVLIAEYCLYNDNPAHFLINIFINQKLIVNNKDMFGDYDTCSQYLLEIGWEARGGFNESILTKTERRLNDFRERLSELYPHRQFASIKEWIFATNDFCKNELSNRFVISSLYNMSHADLNSFIDKVMDAIGIPVISFKDHTVTSNMLPPQYSPDQFLEFYIVHQFVIWVQTGERACPIYDICNKNFGVCEALCLSNPVAYSGDCHFKLFLKSYSLDMIKFKYADEI